MSSASQPQQASLLAGGEATEGCNCLNITNAYFWAAVEEGEVERLKRMLADDLLLVKQTKSYRGGSLSAWHIAAKEGHVGILRALAEAVLSCGSNHIKLNNSLRRVLAMSRSGETLLQEFVNWTSFSGLTPLMLACRNGHLEAMTFLLSSGADAWIGDAEGLSALHYAARHNRWEIIRGMLQSPPEYSKRATRLNKPTTKYVNVLDVYSYTPLHHAAAEQKLDAVATLIAHGANIICRTWFQSGFYPLWPRGMSPLHIAAWKGNLPIARHIVRTYFESNANLLPSQTPQPEQQQRARAHPDPRRLLTGNSMIPYSIAVRFGHAELLDLLDPAVPLMFMVFDDADQNEGGAGEAVGPPRLALIASRVLHANLLAQLDAAEQQLEVQAAQQQQQQQQQQQLQQGQQERQEQQEKDEEQGSQQGRGLGAKPVGLVKQGHGGLKIKKRHRRFMSMLGHELSRLNPQAVLLVRRGKAREGGGDVAAGGGGSTHPMACASAAAAQGMDAQLGGKQDGRAAVQGGGAGARLLQGQHLAGPSDCGPDRPAHNRAPLAPRKLQKLHALAQAQTQLARGAQLPLSRPLPAHPALSPQPPPQPPPPAPRPPSGHHVRQRTRSFTAVNRSPLDLLLQGGTGLLPTNSTPHAADGHAPRRHSLGLNHGSLRTGGRPWHDHALLLARGDARSDAPMAEALVPTPDWLLQGLPSFSQPPPQVPTGTPPPRSKASFSSRDVSQHMSATGPVAQLQGEPWPSSSEGGGVHKHGRKGKAAQALTGRLFGRGSLLQRLAKSMQDGSKASMLRWDLRHKRPEEQHDNSMPNLARESQDVFNRAALMSMGMYAPLNVDSNPVAQLRFSGPDVPTDPASLRAALGLHSPLARQVPLVPSARPAGSAAVAPPVQDEPCEGAAAAEAEAEAEAGAEAGPGVRPGGAGCPVAAGNECRRSREVEGGGACTDAAAAMAAGSHRHGGGGGFVPSLTSPHATVPALPRITPVRVADAAATGRQAPLVAGQEGGLPGNQDALQVGNGERAVGTSQGVAAVEADAAEADGVSAGGDAGGDGGRGSDQPEEVATHAQALSHGTGCDEPPSRGSGSGIGCGSVIEHGSTGQDRGLLELLGSQDDMQSPLSQRPGSGNSSNATTATTTTTTSAASPVQGAAAGADSSGASCRAPAANQDPGAASPLSPPQGSGRRSLGAHPSLTAPAVAHNRGGGSWSARERCASAHARTSGPGACQPFSEQQQSTSEHTERAPHKLAHSPHAAAAAGPATAAAAATAGEGDAAATLLAPPGPLSAGKAKSGKAAAALAALTVGDSRGDASAWGSWQPDQQLLGPLTPRITKEVMEEGECEDSHAQTDQQARGEGQRSGHAGVEFESWPMLALEGSLGEPLLPGASLARVEKEAAYGIYRVSDSGMQLWRRPGSGTWAGEGGSGGGSGRMRDRLHGADRTQAPARRSLHLHHSPLLEPAGKQAGQHRKAASMDGALEQEAVAAAPTAPFNQLAVFPPLPPCLPPPAMPRRQRSSSLGALEVELPTHWSWSPSSSPPPLPATRLAAISEQEQQQGGQHAAALRDQGLCSDGACPPGGLGRDSSKGGTGGAWAARRRRPLSAKRVPPLLLSRLQRQLNRRSNQVSPGPQASSSRDPSAMAVAVAADAPHEPQAGGLTRQSSSCSRASSARQPRSGGSQIGITPASLEAGVGHRSSDIGDVTHEGTRAEGCRCSTQAQGAGGADLPPHALLHVPGSSFLQHQLGGAAPRSTSRRAQHQQESASPSAHTAETAATEGTPLSSLPLQQQLHGGSESGHTQGAAACTAAHVLQQDTQQQQAQQPTSRSATMHSSVCLADEEDDMCPVCLDAPPNIEVLHCHHVLCAPCAKDLCMRHSVAPALCPMCRIVISGFRVAIPACDPTSKWS